MSVSWTCRDGCVAGAGAPVLPLPALGVPPPELPPPFDCAPWDAAPPLPGNGAEAKSDCPLTRCVPEGPPPPPPPHAASDEGTMAREARATRVGPGGRRNERIGATCCPGA